MIPASASVSLFEWETLGPDKCPDLAGRFIGDSADTRSIADGITSRNLLGLRELRNGLQIQAYSHVGRVRIGDLNVTILPKITGKSLLNLTRYAYGFRRLNLISDSTHLVGHCGFEDLLISQLNAEVRELISRGLIRAYIPTSERLSSPRGRIDLARMALDGGTATATLPCLHHPRIEDTLLNRVLMAGLRLAATMASVVDLGRESRRLATIMDEQVSSIRIDATILIHVTRQMNRLTRAYAPALSIIRLLVEAQGVALYGQTNSTRLPGFLFDMNAFFQCLVSRFLHDNLPGYSVLDEHGLKGMVQYNPNFNPQRRQSPTPRPDFIVKKKGKNQSILDAKYRDLWEKQLPREMLYQLVVYAISNRSNPQSIILYPTMESRARESRIDVSDPINGRPIGQVCLRPIHLPTIERMIKYGPHEGRMAREIFAKQLVFGVI